MPQIGNLYRTVTINLLYGKTNSPQKTLSKVMKISPSRKKLYGEGTRKLLKPFQFCKLKQKSQTSCFLSFNCLRIIIVKVTFYSQDNYIVS